MPHPLRSLAFATSLVVLTALATTPTQAQVPVPDLEQQVRSKAAQIEDKLIAWRRDIHQNPELGEQETRTANLVAEHLSKLSGTEFDRQYVPQQLADHETTLSLFQVQSNRGNDVELKQFAQRYTPVIQRHVEMLRRMSMQTISSN